MHVQLKTDGTGGTCEDLGGHADSCAWVLDGASGAVRADVTDAPSDGRWYVEQFDDFLRANADAPVPLPEVLRRGVETVAERFRRLPGATDLDRVEQPLAAGAVVRERGEHVEFLLSADCSIAVQRPSGSVEPILGDGPRSLDARVLDTIRRLEREDGLTHEQARDRTRESIVDNRRQLNTPGGYWALSLTPRAVDHARGSTLDVEDVERIALFSDGLERLFESYEAMSYESMFEFAADGDVERPFEVLRDIEENDPDCSTHPRIKPSDDAALAVVDLG